MNIGFLTSLLKSRKVLLAVVGLIAMKYAGATPEDLSTAIKQLATVIIGGIALEDHGKHSNGKGKK